MSNNIRIASVYRDSLHFIDMMSDKDLARFVRAQVAATLGRPLPDMSKLAKALFDTHNEIEQRFEDARRKRSEDGRKGGNPTLNQPLTEVQPTLNHGSTEVQPTLNHGSTEVKPITYTNTLKDQDQKEQDLKDQDQKEQDRKEQDLKDQEQNPMVKPMPSADGVDHSAVIKQMIYKSQSGNQTTYLQPVQVDGTLNNASPKTNGGNKDSVSLRQGEALRNIRACKNVFEGRSFSDPMRLKVEEWLKYKDERKESYKPTGLKNLLTQIEKKIIEHSEDQVIVAIGDSMANNYKGIVWERIKPLTLMDAKKQSIYSHMDKAGIMMDSYQGNNQFLQYALELERAEKAGGI